MKLNIIYVTDPYCCWCYGFSGVVQQLASTLEERASLVTLSPGMINGKIRLAQLFASFADPIGLHQRITAMSGCTFGESYLTQLRTIKASPWIVDSTTPARAVAVLRRYQPDNSLAHATAISQAYYLHGKDLQDEQTYQSIAQSFGIDVDSFVEAFRSNDSARAAQKEFDEVAKLDVSGYPAILLELPDKKTVPVLSGFMTYEAALARLDAALSNAAEHFESKQRAPSCSAAGQGC